MLIESIIKRAGGTVITMPTEGKPDTEYHFKPEDGLFDSPHVAEVNIQQHVDRFLSISEGFRVPGFDGEELAVIAGGDYANMAAIDPDAVSNKWLASFSRDVLKISPTSKTLLAERLQKAFGKEVDHRTLSATEIIREFVRCAVLEERANQDADQENERQREAHQSASEKGNA